MVRTQNKLDLLAGRKREMTTGTRLHSLMRTFFVAAIFYCNQVTHLLMAGSESELFPIPENLRDNIEFWKNVYTLYDQDQIIIHDSQNLNIVYEIYDEHDLISTNKISPPQRWQEIENIKNKYKRILLKLAEARDIRPDLLAAEDRIVYNLFIPETTPEKFRQAAQNIRAQQGLRDQFRKGLIRAQHCLPQMKQIFQQHNVPLELLALPHVESSFYHKAYSKYGAAGIWQFTRKTGRRFLKIDYTVDERLDPIKSSEAAAELLRENYEKLGSWPLAVTAYNHGVNGMERAVAILKTDDLGTIVEKYQSPSFKFASRNFYAEFIAAKEVEENYRIYFGDIQFEEPRKYFTFELPNYVSVKTLAQRLAVSVEEIEELNPSLRSCVLSSKRRIPKGFLLKIPFRDNFDPALAYAQIPGNEKFQKQSSADWYQVQYGDTLDRIAKQFQMPPTELMEMNQLESANQIFVGQLLKIKAESSLENSSEKSTAFAQSISRNAHLKIDESNVRGVRLFGPQVYDKANDAGSENKTIAKIVVQPNETLGHFADWLQIPTQDLRQLNKMNFDEEIQLAQEIIIDFRRVSEETFRHKRLEFHRSIEEDFFATFKVTEIKSYQIRAGDDIMNLCNEIFNVPYWLVSKYNPDKDLLNLKTSDIILFPVVENIAANSTE